jgi:hypothetical protein
MVPVEEEEGGRGFERAGEAVRERAEGWKGGWSAV